MVSIIQLAIIILVIVGMWKVFIKAGKPGWASIIPIYNIYVLLQIVDKPWWWLILMLIPIANIVIWILVSLALSQKFAQGTGFAIGLILLPFIFVPILGFGDAKYTGSTIVSVAVA